MADVYQVCRAGEWIVVRTSEKRMTSGRWLATLTWAGRYEEIGCKSLLLHAATNEQAHAIAIEIAKQRLGEESLADLFQYG